MGQFKNQAEAEAAGVYISKVKSYVKREGRLTRAQARALEDHWPTMGIDFRDTEPGSINLSELSFLIDFSLQPDTFTLASLTFDAMNIGAATYGFTYTDFSDGLGNNIALDITEGNVLVKAVPVTNTILLLMLGLLGALLSKLNFMPFAWFSSRNRLATYEHRLV